MIVNDDEALESYLSTQPDYDLLKQLSKGHNISVSSKPEFSNKTFTILDNHPDLYPAIRDDLRSHLFYHAFNSPIHLPILKIPEAMSVMKALSEKLKMSHLYPTDFHTIITSGKYPYQRDSENPSFISHISLNPNFLDEIPSGELHESLKRFLNV